MHINIGMYIHYIKHNILCSTFVKYEYIVLLSSRRGVNENIKN